MGDIDRGDEVDVVVHVADGVPQRRIRARVTEVLRNQQYRVKYLHHGAGRQGERVVHRRSLERVNAKLGDTVVELRRPIAVPPQRSTVALAREPDPIKTTTTETTMNEDDREERYYAEGDYEIIELRRGEERASHLTVGSWWAPRPGSRPSRKDGSKRPGDAYQVSELIPKLPMNEVRLARRLRKTLDVASLLGGWDPVKPKPGAVLQRRSVALEDRAPTSTRDRLTRLEEEVARIKSELGIK